MEEDIRVGAYVGIIRMVGRDVPWNGHKGYVVSITDGAMNVVLVDWEETSDCKLGIQVGRQHDAIAS